MLRSIWNRLSYVGVDPERRLEFREIILSNRVVAISILLVVLFIPIEIMLNGFQLVPIELFCGALFSIVFLMHRKGYFTFAKYFIVFYAVLMVGLMTVIVGGSSGSEYVLLSIIVTPMVLFNDKRHMFVMLIFVCVSFYAVKFLSKSLDPIVEVPLSVRISVQPFMVFMGMVILVSQVFYFKSLTISFQELLKKSNKTLEEKNKEITDSINYAKRIQSAILPPQKLIKEYLPNSFVLYKPKDIVAGDFYWMESVGDSILFAAADCTGHGVPGAMVSVVCNNGLNRAVREFGLTEPGKILDKTRELIIQEFEKSEEDVKDGMDISLCSLSIRTRTLKWAGANNPIWIFRKESDIKLIEIKPDKQPIGKYAEPKPFTTHSIELEKGDVVYVFTDGYQDQFGGEKGKKFKASKMKELLLSLYDNSMEEQRQVIDNSFESWKGNLEQVDDVCVIGVRI
ncbi:MAG: PP2C family protein-serine/threonine phosphatase [Bacteroidia bacterium]